MNLKSANFEFKCTLLINFKGFPLKLAATKVEVKKSDFQPDFVNRMMKKIDYKVLYEAAQSVCVRSNCSPEEICSSYWIYL